MADQENNYVVGRGKVYFDQFAVGTKISTGERYFGNTPEFSLSQSEETLDHWDSDSKVKTKDASVTISNESSGSIVTDNVSAENLALWFGADGADTVAVSAAVGLTQDIPSATLGTYIQLGTSEVLPQGHGFVDNVVVKKGAATITAAGNYEVNLETGRLYILPTAADIEAGDVLEVTYDADVQTVDVVISKGTSVYGALRFVADNAVGVNRDHFMPYVKLTSDGDYSLKGDDWQNMSFTLEILKKSIDTGRIYITTRPA